MVQFMVTHFATEPHGCSNDRALWWTAVAALSSPFFGTRMYERGTCTNFNTAFRYTGTDFLESLCFVSVSSNRTCKPPLHTTSNSETGMCMKNCIWGDRITRDLMVRGNSWHRSIVRSQAVSDLVRKRAPRPGDALPFGFSSHSRCQRLGGLLWVKEIGIYAAACSCGQGGAWSQALPDSCHAGV